MKAIILNGFGNREVLQLREVPSPTLKSNELLVRVRAAGVNRADILQRRGNYPPPAGESEILGLEIAGDVVAWGSDATEFKKDQRVFGLVSGGGYGEYCCIDKEMAMHIPDDWDYVKAAAIPEAFFTANETIFELGQLEHGESILIHAAGSGVGSTGVMMAKYIGAKVFVTAGSKEKITKLLALGADYGINYKEQDFAAEIAHLTNDEGVDVIEDFIGADYLERNLQSLKTAGRLIIVAYMSGSKTEIDLRPIARKRLQIKGSVMRSRSLVDKRAITSRFKERWLPVLIAGGIHPIIDCTYSLDQVKEAHERMENNLNFGKIVLTIS